MRCRNCGNEQFEEPPQGLKIAPKVLYFDIERAPGVAYYYDRKVDYIPTHMLKEEPFIICWAAAWLEPDRYFQYVFSDRLKIDEITRKDDRRMMESLREFLELADFVIGHNVDGFDVRKVNNRLIQLGIPAPYQYKTIDTLKLSRKYFPFESNGLDYISVKLGGRPKLDIDWDDWKRIVETGDACTLDKAENYCRGDVRNGIGIYSRMAEFIEQTGRRLYR